MTNKICNKTSFLTENIQPAWYWFYSSHFLCVKNKIKALSLKELFVFLLFVLFGLFLLSKYTLFNHAISLDKVILSPFPVTFWICCLYLSIRILFVSQKLPLQPTDSIVLSLTENNLSIFLLYHLLCKSANVAFPLLISLAYAGIQRSIIAFVFAFAGSYLFFLLVTVISCYIKIIKIQYPEKQINASINLLAVVLLLVSVWGVYQDIAIPACFSFLFYPMQLILSSMNGSAVAMHFDMKILYSFAIQLFIVTLFFIAYTWQLSNFTYKLTFDETKTDESMKRIINTDSISPFFYNELFFIKQTLLTFRGIFQLIFPTCVYVFLTFYYVYNSSSIHEPVDSIPISLVFPLFAIVAFPSIYMTPVLRKEISYMWIYRINKASLKKWILTKVISSYIYCLLSLIIANILLFLLIYHFIHINYFDLLNPTMFFVANTFMPILVCFSGYFLAICLPDAYYSNTNQVSYLLLMAFIWITAILCIPSVIFMFFVKTSSLYYILFGVYIIVASRLIYKFTLRKMLKKEI